MADSIIENATDTASSKGLGSLAEGFNEAVGELKKLQNSETVTALLDNLKPILNYGKRAVGFTVDYGRRHPVRMAITVAALGYVASRWARPRFARPAEGTLH